MKNIWYFGLEPLKERYTYQLSNLWMPNAFKKYNVNFHSIQGELNTGKEIRVGAVLDAIGRGQYALSQCNNFLEKIRTKQVIDGDVIFLQDYWTSGVSSIFYALDSYGYKNIKVYAMLHAQSVDEYDFTYAMKNWMRYYELGLDKRMTGIFVGSTIHKEQLRQAGFVAPIHVVSLPLDLQDVLKTAPDDKIKQNNVIYTSRLDKEKNPYFLLEVAKRFLRENQDWKFILTTSGTNFRSNVLGAVEDLENYAKKDKRFILKKNLSKEEYYYELKQAKIQFNCSLQDYVSWTSLEADAFQCNLVYPDFRSFKEMYFIENKYKPFNIDSAIEALNKSINSNDNNKVELALLSDLGRKLEAYIVSNDYNGSELNIWHEYEYIKKLINAR
jgi:glycosyltransferase involved in cell wall biosynthesis